MNEKISFDTLPAAVMELVGKSRLYNQFTWCKNRKEGRNSQISEYGKCTCIFEEYRFFNE